MKRILVTGGCGFIGSNFIKYIFKNTDYSIVNMDKLTYAAHPEALEGFVSNSRYRFIEADICDVFDHLNNISNVEYIVNFAAETHVDRSIGAWEGKNAQLQKWDIKDNNFIHTNVLGVQRLLDFAKVLPNLKRFVQISTDEIYGSVETPSFEEDGFNPSNPYSATKVGGEALAVSYHHTFGVPVCITRSCNNFGSWQSSEKLIPVTILQALEDKPIPVYGSGKNKRDWIYVDDNVCAILKIMEKGIDGQVYNIPAYNPFSNIELVKKILKLMDKPEDLMLFVKDRPGHDLEYSINGDRIYYELDWTPETVINDGLSMTIDFYRWKEAYFREEQKRSGVLDRIGALLKDVG